MWLLAEDLIEVFSTAIDLGKLLIRNAQLFRRIYNQNASS